LHLHCLSLTHRDASLAERERFFRSGDALDAVLDRAAALHAGPDMAELVILSTCNRLELYAAADAAESDLRPLAIELFGPAAALAGFRQRGDGDVVRHLFRVAAGLDSMVVGEAEILGQVGAAIDAASRRGLAGRVLTDLFRAAHRTGKRVRAETAIGRNPASLSSVAVSLAASAMGGLAGRRVTVVGAGHMARKAVMVLRRRGATSVTVVNRSLEAAAKLAADWGGEARPFDALDAELARTDIVISSTGAPTTVIGADGVRRAIAGRDRPLVIIDIAVPRDVEPAVRQLPDVHLFDLDDLQARLDRGAESRQREVPRAAAIVTEEETAMSGWLTGLDLVPVVTELRRRAEATRRREVQRLRRQMPHAGPELEAQLERFSRALTDRLLHHPTQRLRAEASNGHAAEFARVARELFGLPQPPSEV
jgi:glutamyl-tRNA reductase